MSSLAPGAKTDGTRTRKLHAKLGGNHPLPRQSLAIKAPFHCYSTDVQSRNIEASKRIELDQKYRGAYHPPGVGGDGYWHARIWREQEY
jgi:hypothetical protein